MKAFEYKYQKLQKRRKGISGRGIRRKHKVSRG